MEFITLLAQNTDGSSGDDFNWPLAVFLVSFFLAIACVVSVALWQGLATYRARMSIAREDAYRTVTQDLARFQSRIADSLERTASELTEIRQRTAEVERLMKEVG